MFEVGDEVILRNHKLSGSIGTIERILHITNRSGSKREYQVRIKMTTLYLNVSEYQIERFY